MQGSTVDGRGSGLLMKGTVLSAATLCKDESQCAMLVKLDETQGSMTDGRGSLCRGKQPFYMLVEQHAQYTSTNVYMHTADANMTSQHALLKNIVMEGFEVSNNKPGCRCPDLAIL